jgi:hypothetical protein
MVANYFSGRYREEWDLHRPQPRLQFGVYGRYAGPLRENHGLHTLPVPPHFLY